MYVDRRSSNAYSLQCIKEDWTRGPEGRGSRRGRATEGWTGWRWLGAGAIHTKDNFNYNAAVGVAAAIKYSHPVSAMKT